MRLTPFILRSKGDRTLPKLRNVRPFLSTADRTFGEIERPRLWQVRCYCLNQTDITAEDGTAC